MIINTRCSIAAFVLGVACITGMARGNGIELISSALETHGNWSESWFIGDDWYGSPDDGEWHSASSTFSSSTLGIGALLVTSVSSLNNWEYAHSSIDSFHLNMGSDSSPRDFLIPGGFSGFPGEEINIYSTAATRFRVSNPQLLLGLSGAADYNYEDSEQDMQVTLRDVTSGQTLLNLADLDDSRQFAYDYSFGVDRTHIFELELFGRINSWDAKSVDMYSAVHMESVPDSGSTLALSALAMLGLLFFRRLR
jgi:hypothetical protein